MPQRKRTSRTGSGGPGHRCPYCGADAARRMMYGLPDMSREDHRPRREQALTMGGCLVGASSARYVCLECERQWGLLGHPGARAAEVLAELAWSAHVPAAALRLALPDGRVLDPGADLQRFIEAWDAAGWKASAGPPAGERQ